jgi:hypothetical protein
MATDGEEAAGSTVEEAVASAAYCGCAAREEAVRVSNPNQCSLIHSRLGYQADGPKVGRATTPAC